MKGGTATKVLLETAFAAAIESLAEVGTTHGVTPRLYNNPGCTVSLVRGILSAFHATQQAVHASGVVGLSEIVGSAVESFRSAGHLYYIGGRTMGPMALIDVSEMVDTYGADPAQTRAFVRGGWASVGTEDLTLHGPLFEITAAHFASAAVPALGPNDTVVFLYDLSEREDWTSPGAGAAEGEPTLADVVKACTGSPASVFLVGVGASDFMAELLLPTVTGIVDLQLPYGQLLTGAEAYTELAAKIALNLITTLAHTYSGKVRRLPRPPLLLPPRPLSSTRLLSPPLRLSATA
jgi:glucokinase regulatory protein